MLLVDDEKICLILSVHQALASVWPTEAPMSPTPKLNRMEAHGKTESGRVHTVVDLSLKANGV